VFENGHDAREAITHDLVADCGCPITQDRGNSASRIRSLSLAIPPRGQLDRGAVTFVQGTPSMGP
jgi:hypothetical protein